MDGIAKTTKNLDQYITFLNVNCKIPFHTFVDKETKHLKWRDLTDSEKVKLFREYKSYFLCRKGPTTMGYFTRHLPNFVVI